MGHDHGKGSLTGRHEAGPAVYRRTYRRGALSFKNLPFSPYLKGRYAHFPGDDPSTANTNEAFVPMFYSFKDWGSWFVGSINSYNLTNTNERAVMAEVGLSPSPTTMLRAQYYEFLVG